MLVPTDDSHPRSLLLRRESPEPIVAVPLVVPEAAAAEEDVDANSRAMVAFLEDAEEAAEPAGTADGRESPTAAAATRAVARHVATHGFTMLLGAVLGPHVSGSPWVAAAAARAGALAPVVAKAKLAAATWKRAAAAKSQVLAAAWRRAVAAVRLLLAK